MAPRARRKAVDESAPVEPETPATEVQEEEDTMSTPTDDVVEETGTDAEAPRRGRKADPLTAATKRLSKARADLKAARSVPPLAEAEAEYAAAKEELQSLMSDDTL
jgi:hypothetical protein